MKQTIHCKIEYHSLFSSYPYEFWISKTGEGFPQWQKGGYSVDQVKQKVESIYSPKIYNIVYTVS